MPQFNFPARIIVLCAAALLAGCEHFYGNTPYADPPVVGPFTYTRMSLQRLPPVGPPIPVAVYGFPDLTGQNKFTPGITYAELSRAVTQGGGTLLIDVLRSAGNGAWFDVVERPQVDDVLRERKLIEDSSAAKVIAPENSAPEYKLTDTDGKRGSKREGRNSFLPPLRFAHYLFAGGITGYDRVYLTGGIGASYLGIGGNVSYQKDIVNVTLRLIDVLTGEIVSSVNTSKTIYSFQAGPSVSYYVSVSNLLTVDGSGTTAEPVLLAVREAMELAVYQIMLSCYQQPTWCAAHPNMWPQYRPAKIAAESPAPSSGAARSGRPRASADTRPVRSEESKPSAGAQSQGSGWPAVSLDARPAKSRWPTAVADAAVTSH